MTFRFSLLFVWFLTLQISVTSSKKDEDPNVESDVKINIPNFLNFIPDLDGFLRDFRPRPAEGNFFKNRGSEKKEQDVILPLAPYLERVRENYKTIRNAVETALNQTALGNVTDLFSMNLKQDGSKTKLNIDTPLGRLLLNAKAEPANPEQPSDTEKQTSTEVPFNEYVSNLLKKQAKRFNQFSLSVSDPNDESLVSVKNQGSGTSVKVTADPVEIKVRSDAFSSRRGDIPMEESIAESDPEDDYNRLVEEQKRKYLQMRAQHSPFAPNSVHIMSLLTDPLHQDSDEALFVNEGPEAMQHLSPGSEYNIMPDLDSSDSREDSYEEYINDIEDATGELSVESKIKLEEALKRFRSSLDSINFGSDLDTQQGLHSEAKGDQPSSPGRLIDQRDLEIAFLNIDKEPRLKSESSKCVIAFTLTGVPLKIYLDSRIEDPLEYLHEVLSEAGVTLNVPVFSNGISQLVDNEVLYVGAGNKGTITPAVSLAVKELENMKYVKRFLKPNADVGIETKAESLKAALQETLASGRKRKFSDTLKESFKKNPSRVMSDIANFLKPVTGSPNHET